MKPTAHGTLSRSIIKGMGIFGSVQVVSIICSILRAKLVAMWIGPAGIGLFGLYNSAIEMIGSISGLGIRQSSVRDIAANGDKDRSRLSLVVAVVRRWSWLVGLFGALITLSCAELLSRWTFGDSTHIWGFVLLSIVLLVNALTNGEQAILQGTSKLKRLAQASVYGAMGGLVISIPLFYFLKIDSIVPSIIAYALSTGFFAWIFRNKNIPTIEHLSMKTTINTGGAFVKLGIFMTISSFVALLCSYLFIAYLNHTEGTATVGYYQAGYTLINKYSGLILTAIGMEYYPRLAKVAHSRLRINTFVNHEISVVLLVLMPVIAAFLLFRTLIVEILYSSEFMIVIPFISWGIMGMIFRGISWCMAFVIIAKGSGKIFIVTESIDAILGLALNITFYHLWGLEGLGVSYIIWYVLYTIMIWIVCKYTYKIVLHKSVALVIATTVVVCLASYIGMHYDMAWITALIVGCAAIFSMLKLRKMMA